MKAIVIENFGAPAVFKVQEVKKPHLNRNELLVKVHATSVNPVDYKIRTGDMPGLSPEFPAILHGDVAGVVVEVAPGTHQFSAGDRVFGCAGGIKGFSGALGEYMAVDSRLVAPIPKNMNYIEAAALPLVSLTAWEALADKVNIKETDRVLILGGTGGVGHIGVQLAALKTPFVYATASDPKKMELCKKLGAMKVFDHRDPDFIRKALLETNREGFDIVFDTFGSKSIENGFELVKSYGQLVSCQATGTFDISPILLKSISFHGVLMLLPMLTGKRREHHGHILKQVAVLWEQGKLRPLIHEKVYSFEEVAAAHELSASGKSNGKVVISRDH